MKSENHVPMANWLPNEVPIWLENFDLFDEAMLKRIEACRKTSCTRHRTNNLVAFTFVRAGWYSGSVSVQLPCEICGTPEDYRQSYIRLRKQYKDKIDYYEKSEKVITKLENFSFQELDMIREYFRYQQDDFDG